ncbi:MAG: septal ring lytic transglycosylase RlpA family protein [Euzebya sp.]
MTLSKTAVLCAILVAALMVPLIPTPATAEVVVHRAAGADRIQTAIEASLDYRESATDAVLATAFSYPDALTASALTNRLDAPLLLTSADSLPTRVADELTRLQVQTVWILGGEQAVSPAVDQQLIDLGFQANRLAGGNRYETAREIAVAAGPAMTGEVVLALGEHADPSRAWPDAVASGALAATPDQVPTLLTHPDHLPRATEDALADLAVTQVIILGGEQVIDAAVDQRLNDLGYRTRRIVENSRYDTSAALATEALSRFGSAVRPAVFASGGAFPDALAAGSLAASLGAPLLLVPPNSRLPSSSEAFLRDNLDRLDGGVIVGGVVAADDYVLAQLNAAMQNQPAPAQAPADTGTQATASAADSPQPAQAPEPSDDEVLESFEGKASWYGPGLEGNQTANGETFDPSQMTAAHRTLPFDTIVRVTNLDNGTVVDVRINDRGPYSDDRVLDLSSGAADVLDMKSDGVVNIRGEVLSYGD